MATKVRPKQSTMGKTHAKLEKKDVITFVMVPTHVGHANIAKHVHIAVVHMLKHVLISVLHMRKQVLQCTSTITHLPGHINTRREVLPNGLDDTQAYIMVYGLWY